ncbi:efflux RND transporter periplasmic adaptor subunit [Phaeodactylibacter sp.]|uniref:efflux RND transporter periplasmic adaptor subunit n=1 Tax=Phaeodactylibacter sp. TaxID=1940289 RepID=UPI0025E21021|nr:efflux RND transporter periplasmic adaptor subunit [Phaeodactylibacter sp.]MCI5092678.1 efflux RND transporter periplasmic adaptor subunit [Phaeodactylibacter sp.]
MKFINKSILSIISVAIMLLIFSCGHEHTEGDGHDHGTEQHSEEDGHDHGSEAHGEDDGHGHGEEHEEGEIHLTQEQIETMGIQFGDFSQIKINDYVSATGTLGLPPNALTSVSAKASGFIKNSNKYVEGSYVKRGVIMAYLENPDFIQHQREYLEIAAELVFDNQELARQKVLVESNAGVEKNVQRLQAEVNSKTATLKGIAKQLAYLGIKVENLSSDNIVERIPIYAPMGGYITSIKMHNGMYVTPELELMEIVDEKHLHLELDVFEKDIATVKEEQRISYTVPALGNQVYEGEVHIIGKEFNTENKTVRIHGHLDKDRPRFIKELFVEAKIWLNDQTVQALPEKAIIKDGASSYIYMTNEQENEDEVKFEQVMVIPGTTDKGFTAVKLIDEIPTGMKIVTDGAYYVYAQSKAGELEHEH